MKISFSLQLKCICKKYIYLQNILMRALMNLIEWPFCTTFITFSILPNSNMQKQYVQEH